MKNKKFDLKKGPKDERDFIFRPEAFSINLPQKIDLRKKLKVSVYNQYSFSSCTANALAASIQFLQEKKRMPSRMMLYNLAREYEDNLSCDCGAYIRDVIKVANKIGTVTENLFDYSKANLNTSPSVELRNVATIKIGAYERVPEAMFLCLERCLPVGFLLL